MFEEKLNELYKEIAQKMSDMIPADWHEIFYEALVLDGGGTTYFYFNTVEDQGKYYYSLNIPTDFNVDKSVFNQLNYQLFKLTKELQEVFIKNEQESWFSVIMYINENGKFEVKYNYVNWLEGEFYQSDIIKYFRYKYLGIQPTDKDDQETMKKMDQFAETYE